MVTSRIILPILTENAEDLHTDINSGFFNLDNSSHILVNGRFSAPQTLPSPPFAHAYIVGASATGVWAGHENKIAYSVTDTNQAPAVTEWRFLTPFEGMQVFFGEDSSEDGWWEYYEDSTVGWVQRHIETINGHIRNPINNAGSNQSGPFHTYGVYPDATGVAYTITEFSVQIGTGTPPNPAPFCDIVLRIDGADYGASTHYGTTGQGRIDDYELHTITLNKEVLVGETLYVKIHTMSNDVGPDPIAPTDIRFSIHTKRLSRT